MTEERVQEDAKRFELSLASVKWYHAVALLVVALVAYAVLRAGSSAPDSAILILWKWTPYILQGYGLNLLMSFAAMALATLLGVPLGVAQTSHVYLIRKCASWLTNLFRNTPWLVFLFAVMYLLPMHVSIGTGTVYLPDWLKATFAFTLPVMGNLSEVVRGAIASIPSGQWESANSLGLSRYQTMTHVILPQCIKRALPSWMNWYSLLALATPMAAIIGVREAVGSAQAAMEAAGGRPDFLIPFYLFLLALFFIYIYPIALLTKRLERKYSVK